jgi:hypothetical protein
MVAVHNVTRPARTADLKERNRCPAAELIWSPSRKVLDRCRALRFSPGRAHERRRRAPLF